MLCDSKMLRMIEAENPLVLLLAIFSRVVVSPM
jgi:hypothetical protein